MHHRDIVIIGASARAAAQSAIRAGYRPWCADLFADRDLAAIATVRRCPPKTYARGLLKLIEDYPPCPLLLTGAMENHFAVCHQEDRQVLGPDSTAMVKMRLMLREHLNHLRPASAIAGISWPVTNLYINCSGNGSRIFKCPWLWGKQWIIKPHESAGGGHVRKSRLWSHFTNQDHLQEYIPGQSIGVVWRGREDHCDLLGASLQIIGDSKLGGKGFQYSGSMGPWPLTAGQQQALHQLGLWLTRQYHITGLFGGDFILDRHHTLWPIEFNPRYTASVEVLEKAGNFAALDPLSLPQPHKAIQGKAYVFAQKDGLAIDLYDSFTPDEIADVPTINSNLRKGQPICTVFAQGEDFPVCLSRLHDMAQRLYTRLS